MEVQHPAFLNPALGGSERSASRVKPHRGGPPYLRIQYPWFQLSSVYRGPKNIWKTKKNKRFVSFKTRTGRNTVKSSSPNAPSS